MADNNNSNYTNVILEEVRGQYKAIQEGLDNLKDVPTRLDRIENDVSELKSDMKIVKTVVRQHSADLHLIREVTREHSADIVELKAKTGHL